MWKVLLLGLYTVVAVRGLAKGAPFQPEEKWKPLDNPRNRELKRNDDDVSVTCTLWIPCCLICWKDKFAAVTLLGIVAEDVTLQAYFSGRGLDLTKFPATFTMNNEGPRPVMFYSDPIASAFADYEERRNSFPNYFKG